MSIPDKGPFDLAPLTGPLAVVESVQRAPSGPVVHAHAKIIHVMAGRTQIETPDGTQVAGTGDVVTVAAGSPCFVCPDPWVRSWTIYLDETFFRSYMRWAIPDDAVLMQNPRHSSEDAHPLRVHLSAGTLSRLEPIWRRMSLTTAADSYSAAATVMMLFAQAVGVVVPELLPTVTPPPDSRRAAAIIARDCCRFGRGPFSGRSVLLPRIGDLDSGVLEVFDIARGQHRLVGATDSSNLSVESIDRQASAVTGAHDSGVLDRRRPIEGKDVLVECGEYLFCRGFEQLLAAAGV